MFTIDEIRIEGEEDGFVLNIFCEEDRELRRFKIGLPDQFHAEVERTIGLWLAEGEAARTRAGKRGADLQSVSAYYAAHPEDAGNPDLARDIERGK